MHGVLQLETIATDSTAEGGVGSASSVHLLNLEIRSAAAGEGEEAAAQVRREPLPHLLTLDMAPHWLVGILARTIRLDTTWS